MLKSIKRRMKSRTKMKTRDSGQLHDSLICPSQMFKQAHITDRSAQVCELCIDYS